MKRKAPEPKATMTKELSIRLHPDATLSDVQQAISDLRAQGAPETARLSISGGSVWDSYSTHLRAEWTVAR